MDYRRGMIVKETKRWILVKWYDNPLCLEKVWRKTKKYNRVVYNLIVEELNGNCKRNRSSISV